MKVKCPQCKKDVVWNTKALFRPFCSKRCQLIDLGQWADEEHAIPSDQNKHDLLPDNIMAEDIDVEEIEEMLNRISKDSEQFFKP